MKLCTPLLIEGNGIVTFTKYVKSNGALSQTSWNRSALWIFATYEKKTFALAKYTKETARFHWRCNTEMCVFVGYANWPWICISQIIQKRLIILRVVNQELRWNPKICASVQYLWDCVFIVKLPNECFNCYWGKWASHWLCKRPLYPP